MRFNGTIVLAAAALMLASCSTGGDAAQDATYSGPGTLAPEKGGDPRSGEDPRTTAGLQPCKDPLTLDGKPVQVNRGVYTLYPDTVPAAPKAPTGYRVCYLSHYGRHGSRYLQYDTQYVHIRRVLEKAHADGKLTVLGEDVRDRYLNVYDKYAGRGGELSSVGQAQQRNIAERMVRNWPRLFRRGSHMIVRSTNLERTMLSMNAFLDRVCELRRDIVMDVDASGTELFYLNPHSSGNPACTPEYSRWRSEKGPWRPEFYAYRDSVIDCSGFGERIFTDMEYATANFSVIDLMEDLYFFSVGEGSSPVEPAGFFDIFTQDELDALSHVEPAIFYIEKGAYPDERALGSTLAESLLNDFMTKTDSDLEDGTTARLRFGHDGCMASLFALMELDGWNQRTSCLDSIWTAWDTSKLTMASNLQLVFFRNGAGNVLFTPMLNESPLALPLECECSTTRDGITSYFYNWEDFKSFYRPVVQNALDRLEADRKSRQQQ